MGGTRQVSGAAPLFAMPENLSITRAWSSSRDSLERLENVEKFNAFQSRYGENVETTNRPKMAKAMILAE